MIMSKYITDEKLRKIVYDFDNMDLNLDNMILKDKHTFSDKHNEKMDNLFATWKKEEEKNKKIKPVKFHSKSRKYKIIASILVIFLIGISTFHTDRVLAYANKFKYFVIQEFEKYSIFKVDEEITTDDNLEFDNFVLDYKSSDFKLEYQNKLKSYQLYEYKNSDGNYFYIKVLKSKKGLDILLDSEDAEVRSKTIDNIEYSYVEKNGVVYLYYFKGNLTYSIETDISLEDIFDEIKKIK